MNGSVLRVFTVVAVFVTAMWAGGLSEIVVAEDTLDEAKLIGVLKSDAGWLEKQEACRGLRRVGTEKAVPALAALLSDEKLSHMARYALESMSHPAAGRALRAALAGTDGTQKIGIISSLGARRDDKAVPMLVSTLEGPDVDVARAAAHALGRIGTTETAKVLTDFSKSAPASMRPALAEGLLTAGQVLVRDGKGGMAAPIYSDLLEDGWPVHVRAGAFYGLAIAQPEKAPGRMIKALAGPDRLFRNMAAQIVAETSGTDATKEYAAALLKLPPDGQAALLRGLTDRGDPVAGPAAARAVESPERNVKIAAVKALGPLGNADDVTVLASMLDSSDADLAMAARKSLASMPGTGVDTAVADTVSKVNPVVRAQLLDLIAARKIEQAVPVVIKSLDDDDIRVRVAALRALAPLGGKREVLPVVNVVKKTANSNERNAAERALGAICARSGDDVLPAVLNAMRNAGPEPRVVLLAALGQIGGPEALTTVLAHLDDSNEDISGQAVRVLSGWPTREATPHLLELARDTDLSRQVLGLRGYIRMARTESSVKKKTRMLKTATDLANRPEEKRLVVAAWGTAPTVTSLEVLLDHLDDKTVTNEAASAIVEVAPAVAKTDKPQASEALRAVVKKCKNNAIKKNARRALTSLQ